MVIQDNYIKKKKNRKKTNLTEKFQNMTNTKINNVDFYLKDVRFYHLNST